MLHRRGRPEALHQRQDREEPPGVDLRETRRPGPHPGGADGGANGDHPPELNGVPGPMSRSAYEADLISGRYLNQRRTPGADSQKHCCAPRRRNGRKTMNLYVLKTWIEAKLNITDERGASMVEYGLLLALIAVIAIVAVRALGE